MMSPSSNPAPPFGQLFGLLIALALPTLAAAQANVGEALAMGGRVVPGDALRVQIEGGWTSSQESNGNLWEQTYDSDGRYRGWSRNILSPVIQQQPFSGTWRIDGAGRLCLRVEGNTRRDVCRWYVQVGSQWFATGGNLASLVRDVPDGAHPEHDLPLLARKVWR